MNVLLRLRLRHAAKRFARRLGPALSKSYGAAETYTPGQIQASVARLGMNGQFVALGYAAFLSETGYAALEATLPIGIPYDEARALVARFRANGRFATANYYESGIGMNAGLDISNHGGSP